MNFCKESDLNSDDIKIDVNTLSIYIENKSVISLKGATIDIKNDILQINAPNVYQQKKDLKTSIKILFENEVNIILSQHGGFVELIDIINENTLIIKFHGGCQGCGMVGYTLNNYIEKLIKTHFPEIKAIKDTTSHENNKNAYY